MADAPGISFEELLGYQQEQTEQWREFFLKRPYLLKAEASPNSTIGDLLFHTFTTEFRVMQRLLGDIMYQDADFVRGNVSDLFGIAELAMIKMRQYLATTTQEQLDTPTTFPSPTLGEFTASPKKMLVHALIHSIRHWAHVAHAVRENGHRADFSHDALFSKRLK